MTDEQEYILGTDGDEIQRLRVQHVAWTEQSYAVWSRAGIGAGQSVLDLGCGPGFTSFDLARVVGPAGRVIACDESARFLDFLRSEADRLSLDNVEPIHAAVEELDLPAGSFDAAYARWLLCWVPDAKLVLERVAPFVRRGGALVFQEYFDWAAMKLLPRSAGFDRAIEACMRSWIVGAATIDVGERLPALARACGLEVERYDPVARVGGVGSLEWRWIGGFLHSYLPKLVASELLTADELEAFRRDWGAREADGTGLVYAPTMVDTILRKP